MNGASPARTWKVFRKILGHGDAKAHVKIRAINSFTRLPEEITTKAATKYRSFTRGSRSW
jgi:hypothetical protein